MNRLAAGERVRDNEFYALQNWVHTNKGVLFKRPGTTADMASADMPGASRATGIYRHYVGGSRFSIVHCRPDTTLIPQPSTDLTLTDIAGGGNLFNGGGISAIRVCYTWVGMGGESNWNSNQRAGYVTGAVATPDLQLGHQSITVSANINKVRVTIPAFPSGVRSANIFAARGASTQMVYMGSIYTSGGSLDLKAWIGPSAAAADAMGGTITTTPTTGGSLKPGNYYITLAWFVNHALAQGGLASSEVFPTVTKKTLVTLSNKENRILVGYNHGGGGISTNGAQYVCVFIGTQDPDYYPQSFVGIIKADGTETPLIDSIPTSCNAQTATLDAGGTDTGRFRLSPAMGDTQNTYRNGFLLRKDSDGTVSEICFSRTELHTGPLEATDPLTNGALTTTRRNGFIYTDNDGDVGSTQPISRSRIVDPSFTHLSGTVFITNGENLILCTDGYTLASMHQKSGTILPPYAAQIFRFRDGLVVSGGDCGSQVYGSNALQPYNWASGGTGTLLRFVSIGDTFADGATALWVYSYTTADSGPQSQLIAMKKNISWKIAAMSDLTSGVPVSMEQLSGRVGTTAYRTFANTPIGCMFFASDGNFYLVRGNAEPVPVGGRVKDYFSHLPADDTLMRLMTASYHDGFYKVSYPSSSSSTYNDAEFYADLRTNGEDPIVWSGPHTGRSVGPQHVRSGENDDMARFACRADAAGTFKLDDTSTYQDLGTTVTSIITSKQFRWGMEDVMKRIMGVFADCRFDTQYTHQLLFEGFADEDYQQERVTLSSGAAVWNTDSFAQSSRFGGSVTRIIRGMFGPYNLVGRVFQFKLTHANNANIEIHGLAVPFKPERRRAS